MDLPQPTPDPFPSANSTEERMTFPPFPTAPPGVAIIPFKQFKERGIQLFASEQNTDVERDGLGIPTIELRITHDNDQCKTETNRKRKAKTKKSQAQSAPGIRKEWWEIWQEGEDLRTTSVNPNTTPIDRLYEAAGEFRKGRSWPPGPAGISYLWDQFRLFLGLLSNTPVWTHTNKPAEDEESDGDDEDNFDATGESTTDIINTENEEPRRYVPRPKSRPPYALYGTEPIPVSSDSEVRDLLNEENARKEEKVLAFLNDPEQIVTIFFSSYIRKQGLIWHKPNLKNAPRLVGFFINFLLRGRVFPEPTIDRSLRRCLTIIDLAQKELPLTASIANFIPDEFSESCKTCWGMKADSYKPFASDLDESQKTQTDEKPGEPEAKKVKITLDKDEDPDPSKTARTAVDKFEEELMAANVEVIKVDDNVLLEGAKAQIVQDNAIEVDINTTTNNSDWGSWGESAEYNPPAFKAEPDPWEASEAQWGPIKVHSLMSLLGPTGLPLTHTPGIVEWSVRRVKSFTPPAPATLPKSPHSDEEDPDAVDIELERVFAKVTLEPWLEWDRAGDEMPHLSKPRILESSRGPVVVEDTPAPAAAVDGVKPHDPVKDDITILVEPQVLDNLSLGMGIGATWVQIARVHDFEDGGKKKKKKKGKSKKIPQRYWYMDEMLLVLPSYYA